MKLSAMLRKIADEIGGSDEKTHYEKVVTTVLDNITKSVPDIKEFLVSRQSAVNFYSGILGIVMAYVQGEGPYFDRKARYLEGLDPVTPEQKKWWWSNNDSRKDTIIRKVLQRQYPAVLKTMRDLGLKAL